MTATSNRLPELRALAKAAHDGFVWHRGEAADKALQAGALLVEAKDLCAHGEWGEWLKSTGISPRSASRYMALHRAGFKSATVADLGMAEAERLAAAGLKMMPETVGNAVEVVGVEDGQAVSFAFWWPISPNLFTYVCISMADNSISEARHPMPPWMLAKMHQYEIGTVDQARREISIEEAVDLHHRLSISGLN